MISTASLVGFVLLELGIVLTPGPNMLYLLSRALCQSRTAGFISLAGVGCGFIIYLALTVFGITAVLFAVPFAYGVLRAAGALYLLWLAWKAVRPGGSALAIREIPPDPPRRLFVMGLLTNLFNPKAALLYLSILPQFVDPARGHVVGQTLLLGAIQIAISMIVNGAIITASSGVARFFQSRPRWASVQRYVMGGVLGTIAVRLAVESRR